MGLGVALSLIGLMVAGLAGYAVGVGNAPVGITDRWCDNTAGIGSCMREWIIAFATVGTVVIATLALNAARKNLLQLRRQADSAERAATSQANGLYIAKLEAFSEDLHSLKRCFLDFHLIAVPTEKNRADLRRTLRAMLQVDSGGRHPTFDAIRPVTRSRQRIELYVELYIDTRIGTQPDEHIRNAYDRARDELQAGSDLVASIIVLLVDGESITRLSRLPADEIVERGNRLLGAGG